MCLVSVHGADVAAATQLNKCINRRIPSVAPVTWRWGGRGRRARGWRGGSHHAAGITRQASRAREREREREPVQPPPASRSPPPPGGPGCRLCTHAPPSTGNDAYEPEMHSGGAGSHCTRSRGSMRARGGGRPRTEPASGLTHRPSCAPASAGGAAMPTRSPRTKTHNKVNEHRICCALHGIPWVAACGDRAASHRCATPPAEAVGRASLPPAHPAARLASVERSKLSHTTHNPKIPQRRAASVP